MTVKIEKNTSRLAHATLTVVSNIEFWGRPSIPEIPNSHNDKIHIVEAHDRIDLIAKKYYQRSKLWWIIAHVNELVDLPGELQPGLRLRIPDPFYVRKYVLI